MFGNKIKESELDSLKDTDRVTLSVKSLKGLIADRNKLWSLTTNKQNVGSLLSKHSFKQGSVMSANKFRECVDINSDIIVSAKELTMLLLELDRLNNSIDKLESKNELLTKQNNSLYETNLRLNTDVRSVRKLNKVTDLYA